MFVLIKSLPFKVAPMIIATLMMVGNTQGQDAEDEPLISTLGDIVEPVVTPRPVGAGFFNSDFESISTQLNPCPPNKVTFELVTGFVYSAPADMLDTRPGVLMLTDCIDMCRKNTSCMAVNYETGLCVLFSSNADMYPGALTESQFPVFTLYAQKNCFKSVTSCDTAWSFERVVGFELSGFAKKQRKLSSRHECAELCLNEKEFPCRSANYNNETGDCSISDMDRNTAKGTETFREAVNSDFLENECVENPVKLCEFQKIQGKILKTVDSVHQEVESLDDCKKLCLIAPYKCHSFDYGDTGEQVCRLSHHSAATLTHINEPYLDIKEAATYERSSCYNVTIDCRSGDMIARIKTSKIFDGKIYAKGSPNTCVKDISNSLEFDLLMPYNDVDCNVQRDSESRYSNDVVIQHHDMIVTSADLGLSVHCQYDLSNKSVSNIVDLNITGDIERTIGAENIVDSPNVVMRITNGNDNDVAEASVGDMLQLRFDIVDKNSPYEIFVRDLVAMDGGDQNQITLLDSRGCPTETSIMRALLKVDDTGKVLGASFDAFKFPTSDVVQFRALITPCLPKCEPVICDVQDFGGKIVQTESYGRRKRSIDDMGFENATYVQKNQVSETWSHHIDVEAFIAEKSPRSRRETTANIPEELLVVQEIKISDKFGFRGGKKHTSAHKNSDSTSDRAEISGSVLSEEMTSGVCINTIGLVVACSVFLFAQVFLIFTWTIVWHRRRRSKFEEPLSHATTTESLRQLYDSGYPRRI